MPASDTIVHVPLLFATAEDVHEMPALDWGEEEGFPGCTCCEFIVFMILSIMFTVVALNIIMMFFAVLTAIGIALWNAILRALQLSACDLAVPVLNRAIA